MRGGVRSIDTAYLIAAIFLHSLGRIFRNPPSVITINTYPLLAPIAVRNVHITPRIKLRALGTVDRFRCRLSVYIAKEDLLRLRRSAVKYSWVLNWRGIVEWHPLLLTAARRRAMVGSQWGRGGEVAGGVLVYNDIGRRQGGTVVSSLVCLV